MKNFIPKTNILPPAQQKVWLELSAIPNCFVLYGGTAVALQYEHRASVDFDFFTHIGFSSSDLLNSIPLLQNKQNQVLQNKENTYAVLLMDYEEPVNLSFFGGIDNGVVEEPLHIEENGIHIASPIDLLAHKLKVVQQRVELKDYQDIAVLLENGIDLEKALAATDMLFPNTSNPAIILKTITFFDDERLIKLSAKEKKIIEGKAKQVSDIPSIALLKVSGFVGSEI